LARDRVKLLVVDRRTGNTVHARFNELTEFLHPGDVLVLNSSATLPAALPATLDGKAVEVRLAGRLGDNRWWALILSGGQPILENGCNLSFPGDLSARVVRQHQEITRLWELQFSRSGSNLLNSFYQIGDAIRYRYVSAAWPLHYYQNVYAIQPGSVEMPSAGRAFTWRTIFELRRQGIATEFLWLHTGLSSYLETALDRQHLIWEEEFSIDATTIKQLRSIRREGSRIIAVGTTVVRALESIPNLLAEGPAQSYAGRTRLRITSRHQLQNVDGLLTGLHEPEASHLDLLSAFLSPEVLVKAYQQAIAQRYLWHEFGDVNLIL
jgi:S-adenosylmethionine:tRNA ribosyltransferase-isomerase